MELLVWHRTLTGSASPFLQLEERVLDWQSSPASSLNSWFSAAPNWAELVLPALQYLAGESRGKELFSVGSVLPAALSVNCSFTG